MNIGMYHLTMYLKDNINRSARVQLIYFLYNKLTHVWLNTHTVLLQIWHVHAQIRPNWSILILVLMN
jgi:hypothetical protein